MGLARQSLLRRVGEPRPSSIIISGMEKLNPNPVLGGQPMTCDEFHAEMLTEQRRLFPNATVEILQRLSSYIKLNIRIREGLFIYVRFNAENDRQDFALIHKNTRIFGYDNLKEWRCHPLEEPSKHVPCARPSLRQIFEEMKAIIETYDLI